MEIAKIYETNKFEFCSVHGKYFTIGLAIKC